MASQRVRTTQDTVTDHSSLKIAGPQEDYLGGDTASLSSQPVTPPFPRNQDPHLASRVYTANASARRCIGAALSQSPARSGHSTCIRRIFDDPLRPLALRPRPRDVIYPPLPNVSRQLSPSRKHHQSRNAPLGPHQPLPQDQHSSQDESGISAGSIARSSSESWSDDSIYLEAERLHASPSLAALADGRVWNWLSATDDDRDIDTRTEGAESLDVHPDEPALRNCTALKPNNVIAHEAEMSTDDLTAYLLHSQRQVSSMCETLGFNRLPAKQARKMVDTSTRSCGPNATGPHMNVTPPTARASSFREDLELNPLSPNVCTERGPSKHHKSRTVEVVASQFPTTPRLPIRYQRRHLKENVPFSNENITQDPSKGLRDRGTTAHYIT
ncbi:uncharacterized protein M421DRAFT_88129 [Didymella exigua CBS 183.55]|uniref:Uncharacterized protein n=1 Tax=Didymella exigua CBS 183.55 TaxID=1150837 RepID=A0A6A5S6J4_9PLEO|nr:uncharacterized protein M421DRAFT_88129 [Didymella exigua CBS 183.55]KAF1934106.1 hypothetical protein M421DRAFT_88129 [Didymella exigua CBS 183.55]